MDLHLRWLITEKFQNYETLKGGCVRSKKSSRHKKSNKLRWLATDMNLNCYTLGVLSLMVQQSSKGFFQANSFKMIPGVPKMSFSLKNH